MKGIYYIESTFKNNLYVDIFGSVGLSIDSLKARIESPTVIMPLKNKLTELSTDYTVNTVDITNADSQRDRILNKILIKSSFESSTPISDSRRLDTLRLAMTKFPLGRKLPFSYFLEDEEVAKYNIVRIETISDPVPALQIVIERRKGLDKNKLYQLLNRPTFTHKNGKGEKRQVENPFRFNNVN